MGEQEQAGQSANTQTTGGQQAGAEHTTAKTFTQEQLDQIINDRLTRERAKFSDYESLKTKAETLEQAQKTELEKATERATKAEQKAKEVAEQTTARLLNAEARALAAELGFTKPEKAIKLADLADAVKDGEVDGAVVKSALEALAKEMPELLGKAKPAAPNTGATNPAKGNEAGETDDQRRARLYGSGTMTDWLKRGEVVHFPKPGGQS